MKRLLSHSALCMAAVLSATACGGDDSDGKKSGPSPEPAAQMKNADLPEDPEKLADLVEERMHDALSVHTTISVDPETPDTEPVENTEMDLLLTDPVAAKMTVEDTVDDQSTTTRIVVKDRMMYTKLEDEPVVGDKPWLRISQKDVNANEEQLGKFAEVFSGLLKETNDSLAEASGDSSLDVVRLGKLDGDPKREDSDNGKLTRYTGTTSTGDLADAEHEDFKRFADQGLDEVSWEFAVSDKGLPSEYSVEIRSPEADGPATSTVHFSDWGKDLKIDTPPKNKTGTLSESLQQ